MYQVTFHDWSIVFGEIYTGDLMLAACNQVGMKHAIALDHEHPLGLNAASSLRDY